MIRIGTSGYSYPWNEGKPTPFKWYLDQWLNAVEINGTFYRFPTQASIRTWREAPDDFRFAIKVNQAMTHMFRLNEKAIEYWRRFRKLFVPIEDKVTFWLFQMPSTFKATDENVKAITEFFSSVNLGSSAVIEFRESGWWEEEKKRCIADSGAVFCSVDAPDLPRKIITMNNSLYLRLHGRESWYSYVYPATQLDEISEKVKASNADERHIYLNNDHGMLTNAFYLRKKLMRLSNGL